MWRVLAVGSLALGCAGVSEPVTGEAAGKEPITLLRCAGSLPDSPIAYVYRARDAGNGPEQAEVEVFTAGDRGSGMGEFAEVGAELDWRGESNGGAFLFYPLGATLAVEYRDPDGDVFWSMPACFDVP